MHSYSHEPWIMVVSKKIANTGAAWGVLVRAEILPNPGPHEQKYMFRQPGCVFLSLVLPRTSRRFGRHLRWQCVGVWTIYCPSRLYSLGKPSNSKCEFLHRSLMRAHKALF